MIRAGLVFVLFAGMAFAAPSGFGVYRGSRELCSERVYGHADGKPVYITWASYATKDELAKVVASYEKSTGKPAGTGPKGERTFPADKDIHLTIYPASKNNDFPSCDKKPAAGEKTVFMIGQAIR